MLFAWLLWGDFAWTIKQRAVDPIAQLLMKNNGSPDILIGLPVGSLPNALGMIIGLVIGVWSDRHRGRWVGGFLFFLCQPHSRLSPWWALRSVLP